MFAIVDLPCNTTFTKNYYLLNKLLCATFSVEYHDTTKR